jgi:acetyl esterase/lipase
MVKKLTAGFLLMCVPGALIHGVATQTRDSRSILTQPPPAADERIPYGKDELQFGELRLPKNGVAKPPYPVAIVLHGGCWLSQYGLDYMGHGAADLTAAGVATWTLEYRRIGNPGGGWPGTFEDVAHGADALRTLAKKYQLDLKRVVATGHSAGGHLALLLAGRKNLSPKNPLYMKNPLPITGVVSLAGITDLRKTGTACDREVLQLMGGASTEKEALYNLGSPMALLPLKVKASVVQGDADPIIPMAMATEYVDAAKGKGDPVTLVTIEKAGHFEIVDPQSFAWPKVKSEILRLLQIKEALK